VRKRTYDQTQPRDHGAMSLRTDLLERWRSAEKRAKAIEYQLNAMRTSDPRHADLQRQHRDARIEAERLFDELVNAAGPGSR